MLGMSNTIQFTMNEIIVAAKIGTYREFDSITRGHVRDHNTNATRHQSIRWQNAIMGFLGEIAVSKYLNVPITSKDLHFKRLDVGNIIEVRTSDYDNPHLLLHPIDSDNAICVLVRIHYPEQNLPIAYLLGWIPAHEGKQMKYWRHIGNPPCYWIPSKELNPMENLFKLESIKQHLETIHKKGIGDE
jgi:hypothetical protein